MRHIKISIVLMAIAPVALFGVYDASARGGFHGGGGGGFHGGGYHGGGESRGGDFHGGEFHGGGEHGGGGNRGDHGDHGDHHGNNNNRNNNNGNTTNNVNVQGYGGWGGGGWGYGAADGAIAGLAVGAALGAASQPSTVIVEQPEASQPQQLPAIPQIGAQVVMLPPGCQSRNINGALLYQSGTAWYRPLFGASGVYYQVVPPPDAGGNVNPQ